jgi:curved DNA-binding protein CbpA
MQRNLYDLLGVRPDDDAENLRKAFLKRAKESHPDHHGDDPEAATRFRQIAEAYDILRDTEQRAAYDRLLEAERRPLRAKLKLARSDVKRHIAANAAVGVIVTAVLAGGYELGSRMSETAIDDGARMKAHDAAELAAGELVPRSGAAERGRPARALAPEMPIVLPIENPVASSIAPGDAAPTGQTIEVARTEVVKTDVSGGNSGSGVSVDKTRARAGTDDSARNRGDERQDRRDAPSVDVQAVQVPAAEIRTGALGPSSSGSSAPANEPDSQTPKPVGAGAGIAKQPAETAEASVSARLHAAMSRPPASRAPFRHASLAHRHVVAGRMHVLYCEGDTPPPFASQ